MRGAARSRRGLSVIAVCDTPIRRPEAVISRFVEAWNRRDADVLAALFDSDAEFVNVTGLWCHTRGEIRERLTARGDGFFCFEDGSAVR